MIEWILHRPPHASSQSEIRVAELLRGLAESSHLWTVIWGYYFILIGLPPHKVLSFDYDHYSWFMAVSRARQLLAIVETA